MTLLLTLLGVGQAFGQYFGGDSAPLTQEQLAKCEQYDISPCTQNNILAKDRLLAAQTNPSSGSGTSMPSNESQARATASSAPVVTTSYPTSSVDWTTVGIVIVSVVAISGVVVVAVKHKKQ